jgi:hypothetical protein
MPIKLSDLVAQQRWITVDISGVDIKVAYAPNRITLRRAEELSRLVDRVGSDDSLSYAEEMARMVCDLVSEWDIAGDDGKPYPITVEALKDFPSNILTKISAAISADIDVDAGEKKAPGPNSGGSFSRTG